MRATVSNGFRAPSLQQQFFQSTATNFIGGAPFDVQTFAVDNPTAIALGSEPLKAEESLNYGLGLVLQPADGLYVTIDAYRIKIDDRVILSENLVGPAVRAFLAARGITADGGRYFTNAVDTKTEGIDLVGTYRWKLDTGTLDFTAGYNYNKTEIERIADNPPELSSGGLNLNRIGRVEQGRITKGAPHDKTFLGGMWNSDHWNFSLGATRYGEFTRAVRSGLGQPRPDFRREMDAGPGRDLQAQRLGIHDRRRQRAGRVSGRDHPGQHHRRADSVQRGFAVRLQRRVRVRQGRLQVVNPAA